MSTWPLCPIPAAGLRPTELQWEVLSDEVVSMKKDHHINLKLHFEVGGLRVGQVNSLGKTIYRGTERFLQISPSAI